MVPKDEYGGNVSDLKFLGAGSYVLDLATYGPSALIPTDGSSRIDLNSTTFREIRNGTYGSSMTYADGRYSIYTCQDGVGFMFDLGDTFISGKDRKLRISIPRSSDYNKMYLKFEWESKGVSDFKIYVDGILCSHEENSVEYPISDVAVKDHEIDMNVHMIYDIDFTRRNYDRDYRRSLNDKGIELKNIRISPNGSSRRSSDGGDEQHGNLTFGAYINEPGLDENERNARLMEFWKVSRTIYNVSS